MKSLLALLSIAAVGSVAFAALGLEAAVSALFVAGFAAIALTDYSRKGGALTGSLALAAGTTRTERLGLAA